MLNLTLVEQEIVILKAVLDMIGDMVNYENMTIHFSTTDGSVMFKTRMHMAFFSIILVDFLSKPGKPFADDKTYVDRMMQICVNPRMGKIEEIGELREAVHALAGWLSEEVTIQDRWFPSLSLSIDLRIRRQMLIYICGNITKHNFTHLAQVAEKLSRIFFENGQSIPIDRCILALQDFRQQFFDDVFHYHSSIIAKLLNDVRWGIYSYVAPVRMCSVKSRYDEELHINCDEYTYPAEATSELGKTCYWGLMNDVVRQPYIERFQVAKYLKDRF